MANERRKCYCFATWRSGTCKVTCVDAASIEHTVHVTAQTLYEAVAQALRVFREHDWCAKDLRDSAASVLVKIIAARGRAPVRLRDFASWLESAGKSPAEMMLKKRPREIASG
jgi:hypothetical protein